MRCVVAQAGVISPGKSSIGVGPGRRRVNRVVWLVWAVVIGASGWSVEGAVPRSSQSPADTILLHLARSQFQAIRRAPETGDSVLVARQALGRRLFFDPRWSLDGKVSCATCHPTSHYGADTG